MGKQIDLALSDVGGGFYVSERKIYPRDVWGPLSRLRDGDVIRLCADRGELSTTADLSAREPAPAPEAQSGTGRELFAMFRLGADEAEKGGSAMLATAGL